MKVKCTGTGIWENYIAISKIYDVIVEEEDFFPKEWFKTIADMRNETIDKLLE